MGKKQTIILDFDGVIHSYTAWKGIIPTDPPTPGARLAIARLRESYRVIVLSTRCTEAEGVQGIKDWLVKHDIEVDDVVTQKEKASLLVDDRGYRFDGDWATLLEFVSNGIPEPWNRRKSVAELNREVHQLNNDLANAKQWKERLLRDAAACDDPQAFVRNLAMEADQMGLVY